MAAPGRARGPEAPSQRRWARRWAPWLAAALLGGGLTACRDDADEDAGAPQGAPTASAAAESGGPAPRRPTRSYHLRRTDEHCEVYWIDGDLLSPPTAVLCPPDLLPGERIRLAGKTCLREAPEAAARSVPVVCPEPLRRLEKEDRAPRR